MGRARDVTGHDLIAVFARVGVRPDEVVPAFTGLYPQLVGASGEILFTRHRLLAHVADGVQEWVALSGPTPGGLLRDDKAPTIDVVVRRCRRYDSVWIDGRRFWVHRRYRSVVRSWTFAD